MIKEPSGVSKVACVFQVPGLVKQVLSKVCALMEVSQQYNRDVLIENPRANGCGQLPAAAKLSCSRKGDHNRKPRISRVAHLEFPHQRAANVGDT